MSSCTNVEKPSCCAGKTVKVGCKQPSTTLKKVCAPALRLPPTHALIGLSLQLKPASVLLAHSFNACSGPVKFRKRRPSPDALLQGVVLILDAVAVEGFEEFNQPEIVVDVAAIRQIQALLFKLPRKLRQLP